MTDAAQRLVLASASPRRLTLLRQIGIDAEVIPAAVDESRKPFETPSALVRRLAQAKAAAVTRRLSGPDGWILAADTVVVEAHRGRILGKPAHRRHALAMLGALAGTTHRVLTGVCVARSALSLRAATVICVETRVEFGGISAAQAQAYWCSGEPVGKAGAYAIQGRGAVFVRDLAGSYSNVVGLPLFETAQLLSEAGFTTT